MTFSRCCQEVGNVWNKISALRLQLRRAGCCALRRDPPAIHVNKTILDKYREEMKKYYYDPTKYKTYLDQLGIKYPTVRTTPQ